MSLRVGTVLGFWCLALDGKDGLAGYLHGLWGLGCPSWQDNCYMAGQR